MNFNYECSQIFSNIESDELLFPKKGFINLTRNPMLPFLIELSIFTSKENYINEYIDFCLVLNEKRCKVVKYNLFNRKIVSTDFDYPKIFLKLINAELWFKFANEENFMKFKKVIELVLAGKIIRSIFLD